MDARPPRTALCIMAKTPASGHVKTRFCPPLSLEAGGGQGPVTRDASHGTFVSGRGV